MRTLWFRGVALLASGALAVVLWLINCAFQAAGSVPDVEACDFLTGGFIVLLALYPLAAGVVASRASRSLARRFPESEDRITACGGWIGFGGAALYFVANLLIAASRPLSDPFPPVVWGLLALHMLLAALGGWMGALWTLVKLELLAWHGGEG